MCPAINSAYHLRESSQIQYLSFRYTATIAQGAYVCEERLQLVGEISIGKKFEYEYRG